MVILFAGTAGFASPITIGSVSTTDDQISTFDSPVSPLIPENSEPFSLADSSTSGVLDPLIIEQMGYTPSGTISARTDTDSNTAYSMYLDDSHGWLGSRADVDVSDLTRLYVINGTLSDGTVSGDTFDPTGTADYYPYGWGATSADAGWYDQVQRVRYEDTGREYIVVENKGELTNNPQHQYAHSDISVYWTQSIDVESTTTDFILSFDYLYASGPIDGTGPDSFPGDCYVEVTVDGSVIYSISLIDLMQRNYWYSTGDMPISMSVGSGPVDFEIGININTTIDLDADEDYDYTPGADGASNSEYITVYFDDVSFIATDPPSFEQVDLQFTVEGTSAAILGGSGVGSASITKSDYWTTDPVNIQVTSNTTVSFNYEAHLLSHRFSNSTWSTDTSKEGASFSVNLGESPLIQFHTYI